MAPRAALARAASSSRRLAAPKRGAAAMAMAQAEQATGATGMITAADLAGKQWTMQDAAGNRLRVAVSPDLSSTVRFEPAGHTYTEYPSMAQLTSVSSALRVPVGPEGGKPAPVCEPFDAAGVAAATARRRGGDCTAESLLAEWRRIRDFGTNFHAFAQKQLTGEHTPELDEWNALDKKATAPYEAAFARYMGNMQKRGYTLLPQWVEKILWNTEAGVAGTADCVLWHPEGTPDRPVPHALLLDWKTNSATLRQTEPAVGRAQLKMGWPFGELSKGRLSEYVLQVNVYGRLFATGGWAPEGSPVDMAVVHLRPALGGGVVLADEIRVPDLSESAAAFLAACGRNRVAAA
eukprot:TRINITY_DN2780_c2_g1_i1.p1 TRINITY_DN2780_c2_g1~~TRINITY_DN2780_c2_g1_i1.p1  ORF type:complete len:377 (+),score=96.55 TRINITY_DN2780_c2_g1_i1:87-1133(+)